MFPHPTPLLTCLCSWIPIVENIESRFDAYLEQESRVNRQKTVDNRVHACLYFIQPTGHSSVSPSLPSCSNSIVFTASNK
jgi:Septin